MRSVPDLRRPSSQATIHLLDLWGRLRVCPWSALHLPYREWVFIFFFVAPRIFIIVHKFQKGSDPTRKKGYDPTRDSWSRKTPPHEAGGCACNCHDPAPNGLPPRQCGPALPLFQRAVSFPRPHIVHDAPRIWSCCSVEANDVTERPDVGMRSIDVDAVEYRHRCSWARFSWNSSSFDRLFRIAPDDLRLPCVSMRQKGLG